MSDTPIQIVFCCTTPQGQPWPDAAAQPWLQGLRQALPQANVTQWVPGAPQADYAVVWAPSQQFLDEQAGLKALFNMGAGVDALLKLRLPPQTLLVRLDDAGMSVQMAEYVLQGVVRHYRALAHNEAAMRAGQWPFDEPRPRSQCTVGIMGLGVLGARVAQALQALEFPVLGWSRSPKQLPGVRSFEGEAGLAEFLGQTHVLVNLLPLTPHTENIIGRQTLAQLPQGAYVINVARGAHVVDEDLLAAIAQGHIAGALLDVFRQEPLPADHPFWQEPRITLTPHLSARTLRADSLAQIVRKIHALQRGEAVQGVVDVQRGY